MMKVAAFIVDKRNLIFLLTIILLIFSAFSRNWVEVESDLTFYLPEDSETKQGLNVMDDQFITYGTAEVMVCNITPSQANALVPRIKEIKGVQSVEYDETPAHYSNLSALYSITFDYSEDDNAERHHGANGRCKTGTIHPHVAGKHEEPISKDIENASGQNGYGRKRRITVVTKKCRQHLIEQKQRKYKFDRLQILLRQRQQLLIGAKEREQRNLQQ